jgi:predicted lipid-binding transport protein (Tim44 family)
VPGLDALIGSAPQPGAGGGLGGMLGGLAGKLGGGALGNLGGLASLAGGFSQLKLDPALIAKFAPIIIAFVKSKAGDNVANLLAGVLKH